MRFVAIDFETATSVRSSACSVGLVVVENGEIVEKFYTLIQPPHNIYDWRTIRIHKIQPEDTIDAPTFDEVYPQIEKIIKNRTIVAHNERFDRSVLKETMEYYGLDYSRLHLKDKWECTVKECRSLNIAPARLNDCVEYFGLKLNNHHNALEDAIACAQVYLKVLEIKNKNR